MRRLTGNEQIADDISQDAFVIAYRRLGQFSGSGSFGGWLLSIAYRCFLQHQRQLRRQLLVHEQFQYHNIFLADTCNRNQSEHLDLERALAQLETTEAAVITLNLSMGYSHSEISEILGVPLGTVKSRINRSLKKLKNLMTGNEDEDQA